METASPDLFAFVLKLVQLIVVPLFALVTVQLHGMRKELTNVRERLAHIEGALRVTTRKD